MSIISCKSSKSRNNIIDNNNKFLNFVNSNTFRYSTDKSDIPAAIIDSLKKINGGKYYLGDSSDTNQINLTDVGIPGAYRYDKFLHFALLNNSICLLSYTQGGRGVHTVVDFVQYKNTFICYQFKTLEKITDIEKLKVYLSSNPEFSTLEGR